MLAQFVQYNGTQSQKVIGRGTFVYRAIYWEENCNAKVWQILNFFEDVAKKYLFVFSLSNYLPDSKL